MKLTGKQFSKLLFLLIVSLGSVYLLYRVRRILIPFVLGLLIAFILNPFVNMLERRNVPRGPAILLVYMAVFGLVAGIVVVGIPVIIEELSSFGQAVPLLAAKVQGLVVDAETEYSRFALPDPIKAVFDQNINLIEQELVQMATRLAQSVVSVFSHFFSLVIAPVFAFYLLADAGNFKRSLLGILPVAWRQDVQALVVDISEIFSRYIRGHLLVCGIVGLLTGLGYALIGLEYAIMLGIFAGIADLVPYFGPLIGAAPAFLLGLLHSKGMALKVLVVVIVIQQLENTVISPKIIGDSLGLSPLAVIVALMAGGELYGIWGLLLGVPVAAVLRCLLSYLYLKLVD